MKVVDVESSIDTEETEEESFNRKQNLFNMALMSLTPQHLSFSLRADFKKAEASISLSISNFCTEEHRDSIIEKPPKVSKMTYYSQSSLQIRKRDEKLLRKTSSYEEEDESSASLI